MSLIEITIHYDVKANARFLIAYPSAAEMWAVTFTPEGQMEPRTRMIGSQIIKDNWFIDRIQALTKGIEIDPVEKMDSGTFEFRDPEGHLVLIGQVKVIEGEQKNISPPPKCRRFQLTLTLILYHSSLTFSIFLQGLNHKLYCLLLLPLLPSW